MSQINHSSLERSKRKRRASDIPEFLSFNDVQPSLSTSSEDGLSETDSWPRNLLPLTETDPVCEPVPTHSNSKDDAVLQELRSLSKQMAAFEDKILSSIQHINRRLAHLERKQTEEDRVTPMRPQNPIEHPLRTAEEFRQFDSTLLDAENRQQLANFLATLGGKDVVHFARNIFRALFDREISAQLNYSGQGKKVGLELSNIYSVIENVFADWDADRKHCKRDLVDAIRRCFKQDYDALRQRTRRATQVLDGTVAHKGNTTTDTTVMT
uniref:DUF4806 domain-containing protein n=3 Tax=Schistocephalus solidus TaxID=70667 RepID=A0A0X3P2T0_SCHSO